MIPKGTKEEYMPFLKKQKAIEKGVSEDEVEISIEEAEAATKELEFNVLLLFNCNALAAVFLFIVPLYIFVFKFFDINDTSPEWTLELPELRLGWD